MTLFEKVTQVNRKINALYVDWIPTQDKERLKKAARDNLKETFNGSDAQPQTERPTLGKDERLDGEINEEQSYNEFEQNLNDLKNPRSGGNRWSEEWIAKKFWSKTQIFVISIHQTYNGNRLCPRKSKWGTRKVII